VHRDATQFASRTPAPVTGSMPGTSTSTLGGAAAQVEAAEAAPKKKRTGLFVGLALAVAAAGAGAAVALGGGGGSGGGQPAGETEPAAAVEPAPVPEAPVPEVPPAEIPAARRAITVTIESTPAGAAVTIDGEKKPRGKTPLPLTFEPSDRPLVIALALDGYQPETRTVERTGDLTVDIELEKKERRRKSTPKPGDTGKTGGGQADDGAGRDDTLNPSAQTTHKEGTP